MLKNKIFMQIKLRITLFADRFAKERRIRFLSRACPARSAGRAAPGSAIASFRPALPSGTRKARPPYPSRYLRRLTTAKKPCQLMANN